MPFELYEPVKGRKPKPSTPEIRILKNGDLSIGTDAYDAWFRNASHVELLFNGRAKKVGLRPRRKPTKASYKIRSLPKSRARRVSAGQFLEASGVNHRKARGFKAAWNAKEKLIEFSVG